LPASIPTWTESSAFVRPHRCQNKKILTSPLPQYGDIRRRKPSDPQVNLKIVKPQQTASLFCYDPDGRRDSRPVPRPDQRVSWPSPPKHLIREAGLPGRRVPHHQDEAAGFHSRQPLSSPVALDERGHAIHPAGRIDSCRRRLHTELNRIRDPTDPVGENAWFLNRPLIEDPLSTSGDDSRDRAADTDCHRNRRPRK